MKTQVIIADDHKMFRDGIRTVLESVPDIEVVGEADNGRDTVQLAKRLEPDVVVMDVAMPDLNGVEAAHKILSGGVPTKILAVSMHSDSGYVKRMLKVGASGYLVKECAAEELALAIRAVVSNQVYVSPRVVGVVVSDYVQHLQGEVSPESPVLSAREREVLQLISEGASTTEIAERINLSAKTVQTHRQRIMDKLDLHSIAALTKYAIREGITSLDD